VATIGAIVVGGVVGGLTYRPHNTVRVTDRVSDQGPAPTFSLPAVQPVGGRVALGGGAGTPVVLNFFGSWCPPCRQELPMLADASRRYAGAVRFVGVDLEDQMTPARQMLAAAGVSYPAGFDPHDTVADRYDLVGTPTTVFIDRRGHIIGRVVGALDRGRLQWWLTRLTPSGR